MSLLAKALAGENEAWARLVYLYTPLVERWCRRKGVNDDEIPEVGQIVFVALYENLGKFRKARPEHSFRKWLKTVTGHEVIDYWRKRDRDPHPIGGSDARKIIDEEPFKEDAAEPDVDELESGAGRAGGRHESRILLRRCLELVKSEFEPKTFEAFRGVVIEEKSPSEVATGLGMSVGAVHTAKSRVIRQLRLLADEIGVDSPDF
jgi:RNA polymerase sigma-70 factor (ECF subfamily)